MSTIAHLLWIFLFASFVSYMQCQIHPPCPSQMKDTEFSDVKIFGSKLLYPHGREHLVDTDNRLHRKLFYLGFRLPFFSSWNDRISIHQDGHLLFNPGMPSYEFPVKFPIDDINDPSLIAPWFSSHQRIARCVDGAGVYAQQVDLAIENDTTLKERIYTDFKDAMVGSADFKPTYSLIFTWRNMTFPDLGPGVPLKTNTYQAVIATDEKRTYVMFNYDKIEWITHVDIYDGVKGQPAFVGFNAGFLKKQAFEFEPYSQQIGVRRLPSLGFGNGLKGRFYFQVDTQIWPGCCIDHYEHINQRPRLSFSPRHGSVLGGTMVNVTGPCFFNPRSSIRCKFDTKEVEGIYRNVNIASCISPPLNHQGYVDLSVSVDQGPFLFYGNYNA